MSDYYELLGVPPTAAAAEIRRAYARLAKERHPDRYTDPVEKERAHSFFKDLTTAFNTLVNDARRQEYDAGRARPRPHTPEEIARDAYERAAQALEAGQYQDRVTFLRTAVHHAPGVAEYHAALGRAPQTRARPSSAWRRPATSSPRTAATSPTSPCSSTARA